MDLWSRWGHALQRTDVHGLVGLRVPVRFWVSILIRRVNWRRISSRRFVRKKRRKSHCVHARRYWGPVVR